ncbi:hypothetical protein GPECTOR_57g502 [Gonium pectorale]|uniref:Fe2OG dioxygenase domain-containing protein n=1 Tax=Gonium pectorale TaxID=33097 RepID=A0A150G5T4_GONPE|nr:hypothetical protein GPECTOR_57g502 [Gonium pectorale]|eukprot:KXZ45212.1 hypothetical protein GPECTOR_57g502 [Gonium pectorale]
MAQPSEDADSSFKDLETSFAGFDRGPSFVAGSQRLKQPLTLFLRGPAAADAQPGSGLGSVSTCVDIGPGPLSQAAIEALLKAAEPAPFGRNRELVLDLAYRNALQIKADGGFGLSAGLPTPEMLGDIAALMQPTAPQVFAQLHKLNIYGPGGMFKEHVDTPVGEAHFGSLVVALPGGAAGVASPVAETGHPETSSAVVAELAIGASGSSGSSSGSSSSSGGGGTGGGSEAALGPLVHYVAFFSDCAHEVLPVSSGYRVTLFLFLTYNLIATDLAKAGAVAGGARRLLPSAHRAAAGGRGS